VRGTGRERPLVLHSHLDVVPAERDEWAMDPFAGVIANGFVVGRGALDAKGITIVHLLTLTELARRSAPLERDVILLATPDEETGGRDGAGFIVAQHASLLDNAEYLLTEGAGVLVDTEGGHSVWGVSVTEKAPCWLRVVSRGTPGHASAEPLDAAVPRLVAALERIRLLETAIEVTPETQRMFAALASEARPEDRKPFSNLSRALREDAQFASRFLANRMQAALVRNTLAITVLRGASKTNVLPAEASAEIDARILPGQRCEDLVARIRETIDDPGIELDITLAFPSRSSSPDTALFGAIERLAHETEPDARVVPRVIQGFTDAHYFREAGITAYGFVPRWLTSAEARGIHGANERVSIENLDRGVRASVRLLELLDGR
jgi:acetylornithine deacetylase/succinyl-diaminopimelate desuccinylase-like protein